MLDESYGGVADYVRLQQLKEELYRELDVYKNAGFQLAENEAEYRMALNIKILRERSAGTPVTIISDLCRGDEHIAYLRQLRDNAAVSYNVSRERINVLKLDIRTVNDQIAKEYGRPELQ